MLAGQVRGEGSERVVNELAVADADAPTLDDFKVGGCRSRLSKGEAGEGEEGDKVAVHCVSRSATVVFKVGERQEKDEDFRSCLRRLRSVQHNQARMGSTGWSTC